MKQPIFVANAPIDEKRISFIEKIVSRLARRSRKVTRAMISPIPISVCALGEDISGNIMKALMFEGKITKGIIKLAVVPKKEVKVDIRIDGIGTTCYLTKAKQALDLNLETIDGSILKVAVYPTDLEDKITEVLVSIFWTPSKSNIEVKSFLIDELEKPVIDLLE